MKCNANDEMKEEDLSLKMKLCCEKMEYDWDDIAILCGLSYMIVLLIWIVIHFLILIKFW
jgi:hypothetical protein